MVRRILVLSLFLMLASLGGCVSLKAVPVELLLADPAKYEGQEISVCGWFVVRMEECSLAPTPQYNETSIWVLPRTDVCLPENWFERPRAEWAVVTGTLQTGGGYGHLGMYRTVLVGGTIKQKTACASAGGT